MRKHAFIAILIAAAVLVLAGAAAAQTAAAQAPEKKPVDSTKLFAEIAGTYSFSGGGEDLIVGFWVENGKLYGAPQGQESDFAELILKDAEKFQFEATTQGGQFFQIEFTRGESGKFEKSVLRSPAQGFEALGVRIK